METVGIRELKTHLSRHLKRVRSGTRLLVTEHGRSIATIIRSRHRPTSTGPTSSWRRDTLIGMAANQPAPETGRRDR